MPACANDLDIKVEGEFSGGCADSGFTSGVGTPTICAVGPIGAKAHTPDEFLVVDSLVPRAQTLALAVARLTCDLRHRTTDYAPRSFRAASFHRAASDMTSALFSPYKINGLELANRIVVAPMCQYSRRRRRAGHWHMTHLGHAGEFRRRAGVRRGDRRRAARPHHAWLHRHLFGRLRGCVRPRDRALQAHRHREVRHPDRACGAQGLFGASVGGRRGSSRTRTRGRRSGLRRSRPAPLARAARDG